MRFIPIVAALLTSSIGHAALLQGTVTDHSSVANPSPRFGTLINFDDGSYSNPVIFDHYLAQGVTSITENNGNYLGYYGSTQSFPYYISSGDYGTPAWNTDILVEFSQLQAKVGIGIAGPTFITFQVLDANRNVLEGYNFSMTGQNQYYYVDHPTNDVKFLRVAGANVAFDDLQFATMPVPEADTWAMMLAGLGLVGVVSRRRKSTKV